MRRTALRNCGHFSKLANQSHTRPLNFASTVRPTFQTQVNGQRQRWASTSATASPASHSGKTPWGVTAAASLVAFVVGLAIEGRWSRRPETPSKSKAATNVIAAAKETADQSQKKSENKQVEEKDASTGSKSEDGSVTSTDASKDKDQAASQTTKDADGKDDTADEDKIVKPELSEHDAKGWREFAEMVHEKYGEKAEALKKLTSEHAEVTADRDDTKQRLDWTKIDSQRNAEFFFENLARKDVNRGMIRDDEIVRAFPLSPPEGLFEEEITPTIIRVLDDKDMTRSVIIQLDGKAPSGNEEQADKQWDYVYDWVSDLTKLIQQSGQVSEESFWTLLFSEGWYKCGFPAYSFPTRDPKFPSAEVKAMVERLKKTSDSGMERYRVMSDKSHLRPFSDRLGNCATTATVYPGNLDNEGKPRKVQVLVDTGAELTIIAERHVPKDLKPLHTYPITVSGFGGGSDTLNKRVQLRMKLHGDDEDKGIDVVTTAYVMEKTASGLGVELGTDVMKPLGPTIDIQKSVMRVQHEDGNVYETPIIYLKEDDKIKEPTPQIGDSSASDTAPPEVKNEPQQAEENEQKSDNEQPPK